MLFLVRSIKFTKLKFEFTNVEFRVGTDRLCYSVVFSKNLFRRVKGGFVLKGYIFSNYVNWLFLLIVGSLYGWIRNFLIIGYNYVVKRIGNKDILKIRIGYSYRFLVQFPSSIRLYCFRRKFSIVGTNLIELNSVCLYLRNLRNLFPYKRKGLAFYGERFKLKEGKKVKYR